MADLSFVERNLLEKLFQMGGGYVLDFSNRTFQEFVVDAVRRDIDDPKYSYASSSKANRLRKFWKIESSHTVGLLTQQMIEYATTLPDVDMELVPQGRKIAARLMSSGSVDELDAISPITDDRTFEALANSVREAIENNQPEHGLDRLHTFVVKYVGAICSERGISVERGKPLHSLFGEYVKQLRSEGRLESQMTERILKSCISTLEAFNHVRNEQSFAHDNQILNYDESLFIYSHVCALMRLLQSIELEEEEEHSNTPAETPMTEDDIPF